MKLQAGCCQRKPRTELHFYRQPGTIYIKKQLITLRQSKVHGRPFIITKPVFVLQLSVTFEVSINSYKDKNIFFHTINCVYPYYKLCFLIQSTCCLIHTTSCWSLKEKSNFNLWCGLILRTRQTTYTSQYTGDC